VARGKEKVEEYIRGEGGFRKPRNFLRVGKRRIRDKIKETREEGLKRLVRSGE